jgi:hypothetical protein
MLSLSSTFVQPSRRYSIQQIGIQFCTRTWEFRENRRARKSLTLSGAQINIITIFHICSAIWTILNTTDRHTVLYSNLRVSRKSAQGKSALLIWTSVTVHLIVTPCDILEVKNALVKKKSSLTSSRRT